jgi:tRNA modification GTPase
VDQDIEILSVEAALVRAGGLREALKALIAESTARRVAGEQYVVALCGRPNVGKSTLFNALTGSDAITSGVAGTTRDVLAAELDVGVRIRLLDTAGERPAEGLEREATLRGREAAQSADLMLFVVDATDWKASQGQEPRGRPSILVLNKCDLAPGGDVCSRFQLREAVCVSARTGDGLDRLRDALARMLGEGSPSATFHLNVRQYALLREAEAALGRAAAAARDLGMEFVALDLRAALDALGGITGRHVGEDLLDRIFSRFCLGK